MAHHSLLSGRRRRVHPLLLPLQTQQRLTNALPGCSQLEPRGLPVLDVPPHVHQQRRCRCVHSSLVVHPTVVFPRCVSQQLDMSSVARPIRASWRPFIHTPVTSASTSLFSRNASVSSPCPLPRAFGQLGRMRRQGSLSSPLASTRLFSLLRLSIVDSYTYEQLNTSRIH